MHTDCTRLWFWKDQILALRRLSPASSPFIFPSGLKFPGSRKFKFFARNRFHFEPHGQVPVGTPVVIDLARPELFSACYRVLTHDGSDFMTAGETGQNFPVCRTVGDMARTYHVCVICSRP